MRELKFRAWDKKKKKMICTGFHIIGEVTVFEMLKEYSVEDFNRIEVMQYTGLKDKNGKEIYEGDILQFEVGGEKYKTAPVRWEKSICCFGGDLRGFVGLNQPIPEDLYEDIANSSYEIIGNTFATPELLETAK
jgi:uncharacterized phage protein (TIGR01671 family)